MADLSFRNKTSELRISELLEGDAIKIQCENSDNQWAWAAIELNLGDLDLLIEWLEKQIPKSNG